MRRGEFFILDNIFQSDLENNKEVMANIVEALTVFADTLDSILQNNPSSSGLLPIFRGHYQRFEQKCLAQDLLSDSNLTFDLFPFLAMFNEMLFKAKDTKNIKQVPKICRGIISMIEDHFDSKLENESPVIRIDYN